MEASRPEEASPADQDTAELLPEAPQPGAIVGAYELTCVLGNGGSAIVYRAVHRVLGKPVAIKMLRPDLAHDHSYRELFVDEARLACSIQHPNLIEFHDIGEHAGTWYAVMELLEGPTLASELEAGPLPVSRALSIGIALADAVAAIHAARILHRDVKPENVVLHGPERVPRLIDFGIARRIGARRRAATSAGTVGTPRVMSPEQISRRPMDERGDIWALGVTLYEMLTACSPFDMSGSLQDNLVSVLSDDPRPLPVWIPGDVRALVHACLHKDADGRPISAVALREQLLAARRAYDERAASLDAWLGDPNSFTAVNDGERAREGVLPALPPGARPAV